MGCLFMREKDDTITFMCGKELEPSPCRECGCEADFLCDYPVGNEKTCDAQLCWNHAHQVAPGVHYCNAHFDEWKKFKDSGGVTKVLKYVIPFENKYIR